MAGMYVPVWIWKLRNKGLNEPIRWTEVVLKKRSRSPQFHEDELLRKYGVSKPSNEGHKTSIEAAGVEVGVGCHGGKHALRQTTAVMSRLVQPAKAFRLDIGRRMSLETAGARWSRSKSIDILSLSLCDFAGYSPLLRDYVPARSWNRRRLDAADLVSIFRFVEVLGSLLLASSLDRL